MKTKTALALVLALSLLCLSSCGYSVMKMGYVETSIGTTWNAHYSYLDGVVTKNMTLPEDKPSLACAVTTDSGSLDITITDASGNEIYSGNDLGNFSFTVEAKGKIKITVTAHEHKGSFEFKGTV